MCILELGFFWKNKKACQTGVLRISCLEKLGWGAVLEEKLSLGINLLHRNYQHEKFTFIITVYARAAEGEGEPAIVVAGW